MGRPPLPVGTWGDITVHTTASGRYEARARYRDYDGITRHARRTGDTPRKAKTALTAALASRAHTVGDEITADSRFDAVARIWADTLTERTEGTRRVYTWTLERHVLPALGARRLREITTRTVEQTLKAMLEHHGTSVARTSRVILSQVMATAVRLDAIERNPVRDAQQPKAPKPEPKALTIPELAQVRSAIAAHEAKGRSKSDVADVVELLIATGARIGEVLALRWEDVNLDAGTLTICATVSLTAEKPRRAFRQDHPKTSSSRPQQRPHLPLIKGHRPRPGNGQEDPQARAQWHRPGMGHPPHVPPDRSHPRRRPGDGIGRARQRSRHRHAPLHRALPDGSRRAKRPPGARTAKRGVNAARWRSGRFPWPLRLDETL